MSSKERRSFVHERQQQLFSLINNGHILPVGAKELIIEAIREYDQAFDPDFKVDTGIEETYPQFVIEIPHGDPDEEIKAGTIQRLGIRFEAEALSRPIVPAFFVPVSLQFEGYPQVPIYPDNLRYVGIDRNGNSNPAVFMLAIPGNLTGKIATINVSSHIIQSSMSFIVK